MNVPHYELVSDAEYQESKKMRRAELKKMAPQLQPLADEATAALHQMEDMLHGICPSADGTMMRAINAIRDLMDMTQRPQM